MEDASHDVSMGAEMSHDVMRGDDVMSLDVMRGDVSADSAAMKEPRRGDGGRGDKWRGDIRAWGCQHHTSRCHGLHSILILVFPLHHHMLCLDDDIMRFHTSTR